MFCVECGKEEKIFKNGVCINCYCKTNRFSEGPLILDIYTCPKCTMYKYKNMWLTEPFDDILKRHIKDSFHISRELSNVKIATACKEKDKTIPCTITITGFIENIEIIEEHMLTVRIKRIVCDVCSRQSGGYYEAILQIRTDKRKLLQKEHSILQVTVEKLVENLQRKGNRGLFITDIGEEKDGIDFYLSDSGAAQSIVKKIQEQFGGEIKQSSKNVGMKDGKQLYRMTYLIRLPAYQKDDFISIDTNYYHIVSLSKNKVRTIELSSWKEVVFDTKDLQRAHIFGGSECIKTAILVSQSPHEVQLMDPNTYTISDVKKPQQIALDPKKMKIVKLDDHLFILPQDRTEP